MKKSVTAEQETEHSAEELADGVIAHAEVGIDGAVTGLGSGRLLCAAGDADAILVVAGDVCGNNCTAVSADNVVGAVAVLHILPMVAHVVALGLLCTAGDADAILVVAGDVCGNNCTAVSADNVVSAVAVVHIGPVVAHVVAGVLSTAGAGALAVLTVNTLSSFRHNCTALSADDLVSAVAVVLVLEGAVGAGVAADTGAGLKNAGHISVIDGAVLVDSVNMMMRSIDHGVGSANFLRLGSAADALAIGVDTRNSLRNGLAAVRADDVVGTIVQILVHPVVFRVVAPAGVGSGQLGIAADTGIAVLEHTIRFTLIIFAILIKGLDKMVGAIHRGIAGAGFFKVSSGSESSRSHGQNHCACQHGGQKTAELFQFHKTDLLYTTKFLILPRAASQFIHAWTAGASHFRNILRVVQWFTLGLPLL